MKLSNGLRCILVSSWVILLLGIAWAAPASAGQEIEATPAAQATPPPGDAERDAESFLFYPAAGQWGDFFDLTIEAGSTSSPVALIANTGRVDTSVRTYAVNAFTAVGSGFDVAEYGTPPNDVTSWLDYPEEVFDVKVGEGVERTFTISVPEGTPPGQYITSLAAATGQANEVQGTENFTQITRFVIPVFITVPGDMDVSYEVGDIALEGTAESLLIRVPLINTGDVRVRPKGTVELVDSDGQLVGSIPIELDSIYARDDTIVTVGFAGAFAAGTYEVNVELIDPDSKTVVTYSAADLAFAGSGELAVVAPVTISTAAVAAAPSADDVQFANVEATISNNGDPVSNAQLSLVASLDGEEVERFPINQSLSLPTGDTPIATRYIPATGWTSGEWTFELLLETVEPNGAAVVVGRQPIDNAIVIS